MNFDLFKRNNTAGTVVLPFVLFLVGCFFGGFIDPTMSENTRSGVVIFTGFSSAFMLMFLWICRHG